MYPSAGFDGYPWLELKCSRCLAPRGKAPANAGSGGMSKCLKTWTKPGAQEAAALVRCAVEGAVARGADQRQGTIVYFVR
jgi:hypothetical protein